MSCGLANSRYVSCLLDTVKCSFQVRLEKWKHRYFPPKCSSLFSWNFNRKVEFLCSLGRLLPLFTGSHSHPSTYSIPRQTILLSRLNVHHPQPFVLVPNMAFLDQTFLSSRLTTHTMMNCLLSFPPFAHAMLCSRCLSCYLHSRLIYRFLWLIQVALVGCEIIQTWDWGTPPKALQ